MGNNPIVIYHGNCPDGAGAALSAYQRLGEEANYYPFSHGQVLEGDLETIWAGRPIYLLDFSFKRPIIDRLLKIGNPLVIIDHHKTAEEDLHGLPKANAIFDMNHSGAYLSWQYFKGDPVPPMIQYLEDRDMWWWRLPDSKKVSAYLLSSGGIDDFRIWDPLLKNWEAMYKEIISGGEAILRQYDLFVKGHRERAEMIKLPGIDIPIRAVNASILFSEMAEACTDDQTIGMYYFWDGKRQVYQVGLRSRNDIDVSAVAKKFGGGGHKQASGFTCDKIIWEKA